MELNRGGVGVPLHKMARVVDEAQKFFRMLAGDVHIDPESGEWLGLDFDNKSLNFTAEFVGPVTAGQAGQFRAAFDGVTLLRRATIAQFARIAGAIEEDELIGFGLYQSDEETEPTEWRSLSKRDALRIGEEIHLLLDRSEESAVESRLPTALDQSAAAALFKERREHGGLAERLARIESEVGRHSEAIETLRGNTAGTEQNLQKLLGAVDAFCDRATRQMERLPAPRQEGRKWRWAIPLTVAAVCAAVGVTLYREGFEPQPAATRAQAADPVSLPAPTPIPIPAPPVTLKPSEPMPPASVHVDLKAIEPTWVEVYVDGVQTFTKLLETDQTTALDGAYQIRVRLGNAGGVEISANGKPVGPLGRKGQVRMIEFTPSGFRIVPLSAPAKTGQ
jgi:hypothetical protein